MSDAGLELHIQVRRGGTLLASEPAGLGPCTEDAVFRSVLAGRLANDGSVPAFRIEPRYEDARRGTVAEFSLLDGPSRVGRYEAAVFRPQVRALLASLADAKGAVVDASLEWELVARPVQPKRTRDPDAVAYSARVRRAPHPLEPERLDDVPSGTLRVELDAGLAERLRERMARAYPLECASLLLGRLLHDAVRGCAVLRVTGAIDVQAGAGGRSSAHFAFAPETFLAARAQAARREDGARLAGWAHSHPPCEACGTNPLCRADPVWFSDQDVDVHASAFPAPWMVGLVGGKVPDQPAARPGFRLYGWLRAAIAERELCLIDFD